MPKVVFIESKFERELSTTRFLRQGAARSGWSHACVWLHDSNKKPRNPHEISTDIERQSPQFIIWAMDVILPFADCLDTASLRHIPKAALWFDDFERSHDLHTYIESYRRLVTSGHLTSFIWDGFWRQAFQNKFSLSSRPIHLAADETVFSPSIAHRFTGLEKHLIFVGNTPSLSYILKESLTMPLACQQLVSQTVSILEKSAYGRTGYSAMDEVLTNMSPNYQKVVRRFQENIFLRCRLHGLIWMLAKRETRIRILRQAIQQKPLAVFSGHTDPTFASQEEFLKDLGKHSQNVRFVDTHHIPLQDLGYLYQTGGLHLQATDPQSVEGGIPLRVFETAATAKPLLTDYKKELADCFAPETEMWFYQNDLDFADRLSDAIRNWKKLRDLGNQAYQRFLKEHTCQHRFQQLWNNVNG